MKLTEEDRKFLELLPEDGGLVAIENSIEIRAAQTRAAQNGWAKVDRSTWRWHITEAGRAALRERE